MAIAGTPLLLSTHRKSDDFMSRAYTRVHMAWSAGSPIVVFDDESNPLCIAQPIGVPVFVPGGAYPADASRACAVPGIHRPKPSMRAGQQGFLPTEYKDGKDLLPSYELWVRPVVTAPYPSFSVPNFNRDGRFAGQFNWDADHKTLQKQTFPTYFTAPVSGVMECAAAGGSLC